MRSTGRRGKFRLGRMVALAAAASAVAVTAGCSLPTSGSEGGGQALPSPNQVELNGSDAAAIIAGSTIISQVPGPTPDPAAVGQFKERLDRTKEKPEEPQVDVGYRGAVLVDYQMGDDGVAGPVCIVTAAPKDAEPAATQPTWATYFVPDLPDEANTSVLIVAPGVADCAQGKEIADGLGDDVERRREASLESTSFVGEAFLSVPVSSLTERGLAVLDLLRVGAPAAEGDGGGSTPTETPPAE